MEPILTATDSHRNPMNLKRPNRHPQHQTQAKQPLIQQHKQHPTQPTAPLSPDLWIQVEESPDDSMVNVQTDNYSIVFNEKLGIAKQWRLNRFPDRSDPGKRTFEPDPRKRTRNAWH